jgi:hypothetical protein
MSQWVKSVVLGVLAHVRFYPESDRLLRLRKVTFTDGMADKFALFLVQLIQF